MPGAAFAIPVDGAISFAGLTSDAVTGASPAFYTLRTDGSRIMSGDTSGNLRWVRNAAPTNYECRATLTSGSFTSGTAGSWLDFSTDRTWTRANPSTCTFTLELRDKYSLAVVKTVTIDLQPS